MISNTCLQDKVFRLPAPLIPISVIWIVGIFTGFYYPFSGLNKFYLILLPSLVSFIIIYYVFRDKLIRLLILCLLTFSVGFFRSNIVSIFPDNHLHNLFQINENITQTIELKIVREPQLRNFIYGKSYRVFGELVRINGYPARGKVILTFPDNYLVGNREDLMAGNRISTTAELSPYKNRRGFSRIPRPFFTNTSSQSALAQAKSLVYITSIRETKSGFIFNYRYQIAQIRGWINRRIELRTAEENIPFVKAIILGDREEMGEMRDHLAAGGMSHLIAISGIHLAIITLILLTFLKLIYIRRTPAWILIIVFFIFYGELCYWTPSISRAVVMISLLMICKILQRKPSYNNILAASLIIITAISPLQIFSIGLQLSFISVFVLINILSLFNGFLKRIFRKRNVLTLVGYRLSQLFLTTLLISIFLMPMTLYYFNQFSLNGLIGNILGISLLTVILPLAIVNIIIPSIPIFLVPYQAAFNLVISIFSNWSSLVASLPFFLNFIPYNLIQLVLTYVILVLFFFWLWRFKILPSYNNNRTVSIKPMPKQNRFIYFFLPCLMLLLIFTIFLSSRLLEKEKTVITLFHVGHGDLFLIETSANEKILIDTGPTSEAGIYFRYAALPYFKQRGIKEIDWLIITHPHNDHYGGLEYIADNIVINNLMITEHFYQHDVWQDLQHHIDKTLTALHLVTDTTHIALQNMGCKILHPDAQFSSNNPNEMSIVLKISFLNFSILFTGDIESAGEVHLLTHYPHYLDSVFLKVPHHGSITSSSPPFVEAVNPQFAFIPTALRSRFNLPHPSTLQNLEFLEDRLFISGYDGTLQIVTDGITATMKTLSSERQMTINF